MLQLLNFMLKRINEASGPYQMFGQLVDVVILDKVVLSTWTLAKPLSHLSFQLSIRRANNVFEYYQEYPLSMLDRFEELTGGSLGQMFLVINYQYGEEFSGPGKFGFATRRCFI